IQKTLSKLSHMRLFRCTTAQKPQTKHSNVSKVFLQKKKSQQISKKSTPTILTSSKTLFTHTSSFNQNPSFADSSKVAVCETSKQGRKSWIQRNVSLFHSRSSLAKRTSSELLFGRKRNNKKPLIQ